MILESGGEASFIQWWRRWECTLDRDATGASDEDGQTVGLRAYNGHHRPQAW